MDIRGIRLHRHPAIDFSALAVSLVAAFLFLRLAGARAQRLTIPPVKTAFDADSAMLTTRILSENFGNRVTGTLESQDAAAYIAARFRALGLSAAVEQFTLVVKGELLQGRNVVARSPGAAPGTIVLTAHYDGQPTSDQSAGDDASGVAVMLELARTIERRGHRHPIEYVASDAAEWGMVGAREFVARSADPGQIVAAVSFDHVENGVGKAISIESGGSGDDYAPVWLRRGAAAAYAAGGVRTIDIGTMEEWVQRVLGATMTDQGPFIDADIPAINLDVVSRREDYARFLYHTPGDRWQTLDTRSFQLLGDGAERLVGALDASGRLPGPVHYLGLGDERMVKGWAILLAAIALFVPLLLATLESWQAALSDPASRAAVRAELVRAGSWWVIAVAGLLALWTAVVVGLLPEYQDAPATVRDPYLYATRLAPVLAVLGVMIVVAVLLRTLRRTPGLTASHPLAGRAAALSTLVVVATLTIVHNPFAAAWLLILPAWLWPWIGPTRRPLTGAASALVVVASAVPLVVAIVVLARPLGLGTQIGWYLFLQSAYGSWSALTTVLCVVMLLAAFRLVGTAAARLLPSEGD